TRGPGRTPAPREARQPSAVGFQLCALARRAPRLQHGIPDPVRDLPLRASRHFLARPLSRKDQHLVALGVEADVGAPDVVDDDHVRTLRLHLEAAARLEVARLGRERDDRLILPERRELGEKVASRRQPDGTLAVGAMETLATLLR